MWHYVLPYVPSALVTLGALALGLFPGSVMQLEQRRGLRWAIAGTLIVVTVATTATSAWLQYQGDLTTKEGFDLVNQHITNVESHTVRMPKVDVHLTGEQPLLQPDPTGWVVGVNITFTNDGDDAWVTTLRGAGVFATPGSIAGVRSQVQYLRALTKRAEISNLSKSLLRHGETRYLTAFTNLHNYYEVMELMNDVETAAFYVVFKIDTVTHLHKSFDYCGLYQHQVLIECAPVFL